MSPSYTLRLARLTRRWALARGLRRQGDRLHLARFASPKAHAAAVTDARRRRCEDLTATQLRARFEGALASLDKARTAYDSNPSLDTLARALAREIAAEVLS